MVFSSILFLFYFLPPIFLVYLLVKKEYKNYVLIFSSLAFYFWGELVYTIVFLLYILINYFIGKLLDENKSKFLLLIGILLNILPLLYFKYYYFFLNTLNQFFGTSFEISQTHLPIGISFFTFQLLSYLIDIYKDSVSSQRYFSRFCLYISFFPQLIAGPIVRYIDIQRELANRYINLNDINIGIKRFVIGLSKKIILANPLASVVDSIYSLPTDNLNTPLVILASVTYTYQIYYDFSGYSDMAIGLGRIFGFHFNENFNHPYSALSIQDFWRRWHISLSTWFRDYIYIPLGGNQVGKYKLIRNLIIVFLLTGLWHGASFNFLIWGLLHGFFLLVERFIFNDKFNFINPTLRMIYVFIIINITWIFFRVETLTKAFYVIKLLFLFQFENFHSIFGFVDLNYLIILIISILFSFPIYQSLTNYLNKMKINIFIKESTSFVQIVSLLFLCIISLLSEDYNPFIYFRF